MVQAVKFCILRRLPAIIYPLTLFNFVCTVYYKNTTHIRYTSDGLKEQSKLLYNNRRKHYWNVSAVHKKNKLRKSNPEYYSTFSSLKNLQGVQDFNFGAYIELKTKRSEARHFLGIKFEKKTIFKKIPNLGDALSIQRTKELNI